MQLPSFSLRAGAADGPRLRCISRLRCNAVSSPEKAPEAEVEEEDEESSADDEMQGAPCVPCRTHTHLNSTGDEGETKTRVYVSNT